MSVLKKLHKRKQNCEADKWDMVFYSAYIMLCSIVCLLVALEYFDPGLMDIAAFIIGMPVMILLLALYIFELVVLVFSYTHIKLILLFTVLLFIMTSSHGILTLVLMIVYAGLIVASLIYLVLCVIRSG